MERLQSVLSFNVKVLLSGHTGDSLEHFYS